MSDRQITTSEQLWIHFFDGDIKQFWDKMNDIGEDSACGNLSIMEDSILNVDILEVD